MTRKSKFEVILDVRDLDILNFISKRKKVNMAGICDSLNFVDTARIVHVNRLIKAKLIQVKKMEQDKRWKEVSLTSKGKSALRMFKPIY